MPPIETLAAPTASTTARPVPTRPPSLPLAVPRWAERAWPLVGAAVVGAVVAFWNYDSKPLWRDEIYTASSAGRSLTAMAELLARNDAGLSGWYLGMHAWLAAGTSTAWMRLPTAVAAVLTAVLAAAIGRRVAGTAGAWASGLLVAVLPVLVVHSQEARPYAVVAAGVAATALLALRYLAAPSRGRALAWGAVAVVPALAHPLPALPALAGIALGALLAPGRAPRRGIVAAAAPAGLIGVVPVLVGSRQQGVTALDAMTLGRLLSPWQDIAWSGPVAVVVLVLAAVGVVGLRARPSAQAVLLGQAVLPVLVLWVAGSAGGYYRIRYFTGAAVAVTVLAGIGLAQLAVLPLRRPVARWGTAAVLAVVVAVQGAGALAFREQPYYSDDPRGAQAFLDAAARPGDAVVYLGATTRPLLARYAPAHPVTDDALLAESALASATVGGQDLPVAEQEAALAGHQRVWVVGTRRLDRYPLVSAGTLQALAATHHLDGQRDFGLLRVQQWDAPSPPAS